MALRGDTDPGLSASKGIVARQCEEIGLRTEPAGRGMPERCRPGSPVTGAATGVAETREMMQRMEEFRQALLAVDRLRSRKILEECGEEMPLPQLVESLVTPALERIGAGWEDGTVALSQVYMSSRICEELVDSILPPHSPERREQPRMAIAAIEDHHALGKRIVYSALRAGGFELRDYGHGVTVDELVARVKEDGIELLLVSALMLPSALRVKALRRRLDEADGRVRIVVGGAPFRFDDQLWREVGAHATAGSAAAAVALVSRLTGSAA